jgi:hypothetical protein
MFFRFGCREFFSSSGLVLQVLTPSGTTPKSEGGASGVTPFMARRT